MERFPKKQGQCICGDPTYARVDGHPAHPCCVLHGVTAGGTCPSCRAVKGKS